MRKSRRLSPCPVSPVIESNIPDVDVNELLKQVRVEADRLRTLDAREQTEGQGNATAMLRNPSALRPFPRTAIPLQPNLGVEHLSKLHDLLERARQAAELSPRIPKPFRKLFRQQDQYNALLIQSVIPLFESISKLILWQQKLSAGLSRARSEEVEWMKTAGKAIQSLNQNLQQLEALTTAVDQKVKGSNIEQHVASIQQNLASLEQRYTSDASFIKAELSLQGTLTQCRLDGSAVAGATAAHAATAETVPTPQADRRLDALYFSFENRFRGSRDEIKDRARFYLPFLEKAKIGSESRPILDLGCGRGEWLELLRENGLTATGVDSNETMVAQCKERQLNVTQADALEFLRNLPDKSQGAVTGLHIIEHLPLEKLVGLLGETLRVLQPEGLAIFESPNCKNLLVGASTFHIDPTHRRPIYPETAQFLLEIQGFERVTLEYLSPINASAVESLEKVLGPVSELLYGPQDFAVIGYKSTAN
jgi:predicted TPR repeat methyltransferase